MALEMSYTTVMDYINQVYMTIIASKNSNKKEAISVILASKKAYLEEYNKLDNQADVQAIIEELNAITDGLKAKRKVGK
ncbi:hypothetical protein [Psychromonas aquimarina]|uniref:hypothetical protein n=1 Tax=Psychromonas aquimarina TaxID=444919 RepID=UPI0004138C41|nr:hypothetical protein [Psychromonas aquimarina]